MVSFSPDFDFAGHEEPWGILNLTTHSNNNASYSIHLELPTSFEQRNLMPSLDTVHRQKLSNLRLNTVEIESNSEK